MALERCRETAVLRFGVAPHLLLDASWVEILTIGAVRRFLVAAAAAAAAAALQ